MDLSEFTAAQLAQMVLDRNQVLLGIAIVLFLLAPVLWRLLGRVERCKDCPHCQAQARKEARQRVLDNARLLHQWHDDRPVVTCPLCFPDKEPE